VKDLESLWARHHAEWRDTAQIASQWEEASGIDSRLLRSRVRGSFWETLDESRATLLVTREYEHLVMGLSVTGGRPRVTFLRIPHPSGLVYDPERKAVHLASTRNPNQIVELRPVTGLESRRDVNVGRVEGRPIVPTLTRFYPGCTYLHDLALVGGRLHANAVGENAVVRVEEDGRLTRVWWPRCIETRSGPVFDRNHIQLNSIAAGKHLSSSFFTASADEMTSRRPGHRNFPVDGRGVVFSGSTREPVVRGLTRPHSARLERGRLFVANSGYGEIVVAEGERFETVSRLPGWTRGLDFGGGVAYAGTSRVIPRFSGYAPGLDLEKSECAVHAVDVRSGKRLGSIVWPHGNQIFAVVVAPRDVVSGLPFSVRRRGDSEAAKRLFYAFRANGKRGS
jgi:uncharacterized protein (TIGR03032 family)